MSRNTREFDCTPEAVFEVLADAWLFPSWVVGASRMRFVESEWPEPGAKLHHSVGTWPLLLDDETVSIDWQPPTRMVLQAKGRPIGEARVTIDVKPRGEGCVVRIQEEAVRGPGRIVPDFLTDILLFARNAETLQRLAYLAEGRQRNGERTVQDGEPGQGAAGSRPTRAGDGPRPADDAPSPADPAPERDAR